MEAVKEFYAFMIEREKIRLRRLAGLPREEWTQDPVLKEFKFTNVKRKYDRTTRLLYEEFYKPYTSHETLNYVEVLLNCAIFRYFGTIEMATALGWTELFHGVHGLAKFKERIISTAVERFQKKEIVFTGAYIIPNCGDSRPKHEVVADTLGEIWEGAPQAISWSIGAGYGNPGAKHNWEVLCNELKRANGVGSFMAKEVALDFILATNWIPDDWETYTPIGPGARRGAYRVLRGNLDSPQGLSETEAFKVCKDIWAQRPEYWTPWQMSMSLDADLEPLDLTDIQFQLCEFDKYMRVVTGSGRPKKRFKPTL